ncbi:MAG: isochorismate synthase [Cyanobacteria bacterium P01_A01_bin.83]
MKIITWIQDTVQSIWNSVADLFKPTNDDYPATGVQPYSGDPNKDNEQY